MENGVFFCLGMLWSNYKWRLEASYVYFQTPENFWVTEISTWLERALLLFVSCHQTNSSRSWKGPMKKIQLHGRTKTIKMLVQTGAAHFHARFKDDNEQWNRGIVVLCFLHIRMLSSWNLIKKEPISWFIFAKFLRAQIQLLLKLSWKTCIIV